jgi:two-component system chemotaxis response regulator CheB
MPPRFTKSLAQRLDGLCQLSVHEAEDGIPLRHGQVLIAKADWHMTVVRNGGILSTQLTQTAPDAGHRPSVNALFASLPAVRPARLIAAVLTGMGSDGAARLADIKGCGGTVLAEDASTAIIYGMPRAAAQTGYVDRVVPLHEMSAVITGLVLA